jgi:hypothetical protein
MEKLKILVKVEGRREEKFDGFFVRGGEKVEEVRKK